MNFTREPIIETVITPREGCKLIVRSSKGSGSEEYIVDAVEVVSFGHSFFFRSLERPKSFLVPVSDYEVLELKETRMVLKNVSTDRSIKIGGGKGASQEPQDAMLSESRPAPEPRSERKRDKRRRERRGRDRERPLESSEKIRVEAQEPQPLSEPFPMSAPPEEEKSPSFISKLFPPPPTLIKESLTRHKPADEEEPIADEKTPMEESIFEHPTLPEFEEDEREQ